MVSESTRTQPGQPASTSATRARFTQAQLEKAAGLHPGPSFTQAQLGEAAQRLVDTRYFSEMSAALDGPVKFIAVKFTDKPLPTNQMLHVGFLNP